MKTIERVRLSEIKPNEDNPRADFGDISTLADSIRATGGEPVNPIVCVRDANALFIVDGERRYRAMREIYGDEDPEISITVVDGWKEGNEVLAMLATDNKKRLSDSEMSRGYQLAFDLGTQYVTDTELAMSTGRQTDDVMNARIAWGRIGKGRREEFAQCSLEQLAAAQEFEGKDFEAVLKAKPESWRMKATNIRERNARRAIADRVADICAMAGIEWIESKEHDLPDGLTVVKTFHRLVEADIEGLADVIEQTGATAMVWSENYAWWGEYRLIAPGAVEDEEEPDPAELERVRAHGIHLELKRRLLGFLAIASGTKALRKVCAERRGRYAVDMVKERIVADGMDPNRADELISEPATFFELYRFIDGLPLWGDQEWGAGLIASAKADGFEPNEDEEWLVGYLEGGKTE